MKLEKPILFARADKDKACLPPQQLLGTATMRQTISLKLVHFHGDFGILFRLMAQVLSKHTSSLTSDHPFRAISTKLSTKSSHFG